ncbi:MAG: preprotein translocase subunit SecG [Gammaproteobacteria bacterium]|jgi:preprotein translocase subunit SecG|nr:preprotein translocase subunit SecG [Gammaproteobacteria bacterium]
MLYTVLIVLHVVLAACLIAIVLVQRGPGATMGAAFGAGASGTVFGSRGSAGFLIKLTSWLGVAFFGISLTMAVMVARSGDIGGTADDLGVVGSMDAAEPVAGDDAETDEFLELPVEGDREGGAGDSEESEPSPEPPES